MNEENPDVVVIHVGANDLPLHEINRNIDIINIGNEILQIGKTCLSHGVRIFFISSLICNKNSTKQKLIGNINVYLKENCQQLGFKFIDNGEINIENLWKDGTHLNQSGTSILARNYLYNLNYFCEPYQVFQDG